MKNHLLKTIFLSIFCLNAWPSPASTEYVNKKIKEVDDRIIPIEIRLNMSPNIILHAIGEHYQGGRIFWLDETLQHGLIVADIDVNEDGGTWQNGESGDKVINAKANGIGAGLSNTQLIVSQQTIDDQDGHFAALSAILFKVQEDGLTPCQDYLPTCFGNWYLPSLFECTLIQKNLIETGKLTLEGSYWTSNELSVNTAYAFDFNTHQSQPENKSQTLKIRAIHSF